MIMTVLLLCEGAINVAMLLPSSSLLYVGIEQAGVGSMIWTHRNCTHSWVVDAALWWLLLL